MLKKNRPQPQNDGTYAKPRVTTLKLNYSFSPSRNEILNHSIRNHLVSTCELTSMTDPSHPLKESGLATTNSLFVSVPSLSPPFCLWRSFILYSSSELLSFWEMGCCLIHEWLNKANMILKIHSVELYSFNSFSGTDGIRRKLLTGLRTMRSTGPEPINSEFSLSLFPRAMHQFL